MSQTIAVNKRTKDYSLLLRSFYDARIDSEIKSRAKRKHTSSFTPWLIRSIFITHAQNVRMDSFHCLCLLFVLLRSSICEGVNRPKFDPVKAICDCNIVYVIHDVIMFSLSIASRWCQRRQWWWWWWRNFYTLSNTIRIEAITEDTVDTFARISFLSKITTCQVALCLRGVFAKIIIATLIYIFRSCWSDSKDDAKKPAGGACAQMSLCINIQFDWNDGGSNRSLSSSQNVVDLLASARSSGYGSLWGYKHILRKA